MHGERRQDFRPWSDVDFDELQINVRRSIYLNVIGHCKTEASRKPVPMGPIVASELWSWKQDSPYRQSDDWLFASSRTRGRNPYWPDSLLARVIRPAALRAGIGKHIGWQDCMQPRWTRRKLSPPWVWPVQDWGACCKRI